MSVDRQAHEASAHLRAAVEREVDPMTRLVELRALRARRRAAATITGVAAVAVVAVVVGLASQWRDDALPLPASTPSVTAAPSRPVGDELVVQRLDDGVLTLTGLRAPLPHTPSSVRDLAGFATFGFSADGNRLAYTTVGGVRPQGGRANGEVHVLDLTNGQDRLLSSCSFPCPMAWTPDGRGVLSLHGGSMARLGSADGSTTPWRFQLAGSSRAWTSARRASWSPQVVQTTGPRY